MFSQGLLGVQWQGFGAITDESMPAEEEGGPGCQSLPFRSAHRVKKKHTLH